MEIENVKTLESGFVYFFSRPVLDEDYPAIPPDIERLFMVLNPHQNQKLFRVIMLGKKKTGMLDHDSKAWGFVQRIGSSADQIENELGPRKYRTKSRGERQEKSPKLIGQGLYRLAHHIDRMYFSYALQKVSPVDGIIHETNIYSEFSYILKIKNPEKPSPVGIGLHLDRSPDYPGRLRTLFRDRRYLDADQVEFLNYEGTGLLMVSPSHEQFTALDIAPLHQSKAKELVDALRSEQQFCTIEPLMRGKWC